MGDRTVNVELTVNDYGGGNPPTAGNVSISGTGVDFCAGISGVVSWAYSDSENDPYTSYQVQVDEQSHNFDSLDYDSGRVDSTSTSVIVTGLQTSKTYIARVKVWDSYAVSNWSVSGSWNTPIHYYPQYVPFTWDIAIPIINQPIGFINHSYCYNDSNEQVECDSFSWLAPGGTPSSGTSKNFSSTYTSPGTYTVGESVTDGRGYTCPAGGAGSPGVGQVINIKNKPVIWKEISPK